MCGLRIHCWMGTTGRYVIDTRDSIVDTQDQTDDRSNNGTIENSWILHCLIWLLLLPLRPPEAAFLFLHTPGRPQDYLIAVLGFITNIPTTPAMSKTAPKPRALKARR